MLHAFVSSQTYWPPPSQCLELFTSISTGAMNRGLGSHTAGGSVADRQDGEISRRSATAPSVVTKVSRYTYSSTALLPSFGSTIVSPPSPVNACCTCFMFVRVYDSPLSCRPPQYARLFLPTFPTAIE